MSPARRAPRSALIFLAILVAVALVLGIALAIWLSTLPDDYF
jgi:hypothetical protein